MCATRTLIAVKRKLHVTLIEHDEGVLVSCPELPGCHSQGANVDEALANIEDAIRGYIDLYGQPETRCEIREMEGSVLVSRAGFGVSPKRTSADLISDLVGSP